MVRCVVGVLWAWMGICNFIGSKWFLGKRIRYMMPEESIPAYRKLLGISQLLLGLTFLASTVVNYLKPFYLLLAVASLLLLLIANKKYTGHWFF